MIDSCVLKELPQKAGISKVREPFENKIQVLELRSYEKYGEVGEDLALDILSENPELSENEHQFWIELEDAVKAMLPISSNKNNTAN